MHSCSQRQNTRFFCSWLRALLLNNLGVSEQCYKRCDPIEGLPRAQVQLDQLCMHSCCIIGEGGLHWPCPTFRVLASDRPDEPLDAKSPTGAWNAALSRINAEIDARCSPCLMQMQCCRAAK